VQQNQFLIWTTETILEYENRSNSFARVTHIVECDRATAGDTRHSGSMSDSPKACLRHESAISPNAGALLVKVFGSRVTFATRAPILAGS
jgi:hypothetical protein